MEPPSIVTCSDYAALSNSDEVLPSLLQGHFKGMTLRACRDSVSSGNPRRDPRKIRFKGIGSKVLPMRF